MFYEQACQAFISKEARYQSPCKRIEKKRERCQYHIHVYQKQKRFSIERTALLTNKKKNVFECERKREKEYTMITGSSRGHGD